MEKGKFLPAGHVVAFSRGCYSDYELSTFAKLLKPLAESDWNAMRDAATVVPDYNPSADPRFDSDRALEWLRANGYIEEIEYVELHMGDYGECPKWENC